MDIHSAIPSIPSRFVPQTTTSTAPVKPTANDAAASSTSAPSTTTEARAAARTTATAAVKTLTPDELAALQFLKQRDTEVRAHEQAHMAVGGRYITSGANYSYQTGADGVRYAIGGEVGIDTSPVDGDPAATLDKARIVRQAALAPAEPSGQDLQVAAAATTMETNAAQDLRTLTQLQQKKQETELAQSRAQMSTERDAASTTAPNADLTARDQLTQRISAFFTGAAFGNFNQFA
ncbi:putative metalloprotease CJM1_0395 family protein [Chromatium okenii]|jgi:hypothetical protein|uniref:Catalase n=1 Tax=Chromatium okenii TaxID=61644 RepID=A0A2S7XUY5_9GAMM|nr:putative metalloprotease CJM1_0395 family protein [Chromatium okenii]PQJ95634.1 hypothetical protein CXB77_16245 [Chromatium okenii]PQJ97555.1 hypothetical protein CXB77_01460 [Chromatium okenii]PQJ97675.1 hypothetical protein CXB77_00165 [Chromatium okenii]